MSKANTSIDSDASNESITTGVFHEGREVAVRARSKYSRSAHEPVTDEHGSVVWYAPINDRKVSANVKIVDEDHPDAEPRPACALPTGDVDDVEFRLCPIEGVQSRDMCSYCDGTNGDPSEGSGNKSFARIMRYGDDWGDD